MYGDIEVSDIGDGGSVYGRRIIGTRRAGELDSGGAGERAAIRELDGIINEVPVSVMAGERFYFLWCCCFLHLSVFHDNYFVGIHDCVESMSDGEHRATGKLLAYGLLLPTK